MLFNMNPNPLSMLHVVFMTVCGIIGVVCVILITSNHNGSQLITVYDKEEHIVKKVSINDTSNTNIGSHHDCKYVHTPLSRVSNYVTKGNELTNSRYAER